jgi:hypothetical protein
MAKTNNPLLQQVSGSFGGDIVFKRYYDKTVISAKPDFSKRVLSEKQKEWNERKRVATIYAQAICANPEWKLRATMRLKPPAHKAVYHAIIKDHLNRFKNMSIHDWHFGDMTGIDADD